MLATNCCTDRNSNVAFGIIFSFITLGLIITGFFYVPVLSFLLAVLSFGIALRFFFVQKDITCLFHG
jgi:hypothetical protein